MPTTNHSALLGWPPAFLVSVALPRRMTVRPLPLMLHIPTELARPNPSYNIFPDYDGARQMAQ